MDHYIFKASKFSFYKIFKRNVQNANELIFNISLLFCLTKDKLFTILAPMGYSRTSKVSDFHV